MSELCSLLDDRAGTIRKAVAALRAGRLVVAPTDTIYGLLADAFNPFATSLVFDVKRRPRSLSLPVLVSGAAQAWALAASVPSAAARLAEAFWPGALTLVLKRSETIEADLGDDTETIAVRVPDHGDLLAIIRRVGPLAGTSANITGLPTPREVGQIAAALGTRVAVLLDGGPSKMTQPSTIVDVTSGVPRVTREGAISGVDIAAASGV